MGVQRRRIRKGIGFLLVTATIGLSLTAGVQGILRLPDRERLLVGDRLTSPAAISPYIARNIQVAVDQKHLLRHSAGTLDSRYNYGEAYPVLAGTGHLQLQYLLFGLIPLKKIDVDVVPNVKVIPGGHSIGVMLQSQGVIVVGQSAVLDKQGKKNYPGKDAGIRLGDLILKVDGKEVKSDSDVAQIVNEVGTKGQEVQVTLRRGNLVENKSVHPIYCQETKRYRIGLYVRDSAAGVGTLTFVIPVSGKYGALGHVINDADTNQKIDVAEGKVVASNIQSIQPGRKGQPGEKIGSFVQNSPFNGTILKNSRFGIFGYLKGEVVNPLYSEPMSVATESQVKTGPAKFLTVISGDKIEAFDISIERVLPGRADSKGMVIKVTDTRLLSSTGGIVQGMSGSPIIQDNKLVGAITHVFIQDATRGYGCFIEHMLREAEMMQPGEKQEDAA